MKSGKSISGFEDARFDFVDNAIWPSDERVNGVGALLVDDPLMQPGTHQPLTLPFRMSIPEKLPGRLPPATPPDQDDYEFSDLIRMEPLTPEHERSSASVR